MTVAYSINSSPEIHGVSSRWKRVPKRRRSDGKIDFSDWAINTWDVAVMTAVNFEILRGVQGQSLTSLQTSNIDVVNSEGEYTNVILESVVNANQLGINMMAVKITFRVLLTTLVPDRILLETGRFVLLEDGDTIFEE